MAQELELRRVLVVDDEPSILQAISRVLNRENIEVEVAENSRAALELIETKKFQTVICDIMMPEMTGLEFFANVQVNGITTPFVFLTGYGDKMRMLEAIRLGATDFIAKPFDNSELLEVVYRVLDIGMRRNRIFKQIENENLALYETIKRDERMIALMRINNNKKSA